MQKPLFERLFCCSTRMIGYISRMKTIVLVSKCLLGARCRWDGNALESNKLRDFSGFQVIAICPEMAGGLPCPRRAAQIVSGDGFDVLDGKSSVLDIDGADVTDNYLKGAQATLNEALAGGAEVAYLKENSPSCGVRVIERDGRKISGTGVTAALLRRHGIRLESV